MTADLHQGNREQDLALGVKALKNKNKKQLLKEIVTVLLFPVTQLKLIHSYIFSTI